MLMKVLLLLLHLLQLIDFHLETEQQYFVSIAAFAARKSYKIILNCMFLTKFICV